MTIQILKIIIISGVFILLIDYANRALNDAEKIVPESVVYQEGDNLLWADPGLEDSGWNPEFGDQEEGVGWVRATFDFEKNYDRLHHMELIVEFLGAYEVYWQGVLIGESGKVSADPGEEIPGFIDKKFIIPDSLTSSGEKVLALRFSNHYLQRGEVLAGFSVEPYGEFFDRTLAQFLLIGTLAGIFLVVAIYYFFMYFNSFRNASYLLFASLCIFSFVLILFAYSRYFYPFIYTFYSTRGLIIEFLSFCITVLLPVFYLFYFRYPHRKVLLGIIPGVLFLTRIISGSMPGVYNLFYTTLAILIPLYFVIWALAKQRGGVTEAAIGFIIFVTSFMYYDATVYFGFGVLIVATLFALSKTLGKERREHEEARLKSSRLEVEILKRNIQPHFLMNTLMNIVSLIESRPKMSVKLIESLSEEFYTMLEISDKKLIPVSKEIELCKAHLDVMSIRNDVTYELNVSGSPEDELIPPAIFHTIVENGMKHNEPVDGLMKFEICFRKSEKKKVFEVLSYGAIPEENSHKKIGDGTGFKYIQTRLEESFPNRWKLDSGPSENGWLTIITLYTE